jgi:hypothetical protein
MGQAIRPRGWFVPERRKGDPMHWLLLVAAIASREAEPREPAVCEADVAATETIEAKLAAAARRTRCLLGEGRVVAARESLADEQRVAERLAEPDRADGLIAWALLRAAWIAVERGSPAEAETHLGKILRRLPEARLPPARRDHLRVAALTVRVLALARAKDFAAARALASEVRASAESRQHEGELAVLETVLLRAELEAGDLAAAARHAGNAPDEFAVALHYKALLREASGDARGAAELRARIAQLPDDDFFAALVRPGAYARVPAAE